MPSSTALMNSLGIVPPLMSLSEMLPVARLAREQGELHFVELDATDVLLRIPHLGVGSSGKGLLVGNLRLAQARLDAELALEAVDDDLEVELAHAGDDHLPGLLVGV